ncbi:endothelin-converting enzyme 1-like [Centruroides vittatus]|uniref:endothelin-converting enzyme 1-like n=1 Tax=Centruroides vittatus TaxID=120091 RepID=UPI003510272C
MSSSWNLKREVEGDGTDVARLKMTTRERKLCIAVIVLLVLAFALVIAVIILATLGRKHKMEEICIEPSCVKTASHFLNTMNFSVDPCEDFYQFSCGQWIKDNSEDVTTMLLETYENLKKTFKEIFKLEKENKDLPNSVKKIIKAFDVCLEYDGLNYDNIAWIKKVTKEAGGFPLIERNFRSSRSHWTELYLKLLKTYLINSPLGIMITVNPFNTSENVMKVFQPSLERDKTKIERSTLEKLAFSFGNSNKTSIDEDIDDIFWLEKQMTNLSRPEAEILEDENDRQVVTIKELNSIYPEVEWVTFIRSIFQGFLKPGMTINAHDRVYLSGMTYIKNIIDLFESKEISERLLLNYAGALFISQLLTYNTGKEQNNFKRKLKLRRSSNLDMKWLSCYIFFVKTASPALDYLYGRHRKEKTISKELIDYMTKAMKEMIDQSTWLDESTKEAVRDKLNHMVTFLSFPQWTQDVKELEVYFKELPEITTNSFENTLNLQHFSVRKYMDFYKQKNDRSKWPRISELGGSQLNAFYFADINIVIIPAGIQQLPYYDAERPKFMNFGGMGLIYGHEMTHGFDESGSLRDKYGNLKNWWTEKSRKEFKERSKCFIDQYSSYAYGKGTKRKVDGKKTLSENIADNGGIRQAYLGYKKWVEDHGREKRLPGLEKYSPEQLFFVSFAESKCSSFPPWYAALAHADDEHAADQFRVIGSIANMKEFSEAFNCKLGSKMNPKNKCIIW